MEVKKSVIEALQSAGVIGDIELTTPPNPEMGDFAFACFALAKEQGKNPVEVAIEVVDTIKVAGLISEVKTAGPYVNIYLDPVKVAELVFESQTETFGTHTFGAGKQILVEYACPNPMKVFHLGHLRNLITGEATVRMFENAGYDVKRVNYQGDVGRHIAMSLWGISQHQEEFENVKNATLDEQVAFLGRAYAYGATQFKESEQVQKEILEFNKKVYEHDSEILDTYKTARAWSLEYFDVIYKKLDSHFDRLYFESEVFDLGKQMVLDGLDNDIFTKSSGAIIFEGSKHGLHDRVFINSQGFPTYEGKEVGLAQLHFTEYNPDMVIHVVGKEQREYFQVVFKALEEVLPQSAGKESHLIGGYLQLKGDQKMSSRTGNVISGDQLVTLVEESVRTIMKDSKLDNKEEVTRAVAVAALKYSMLKVGASQDMAFDMDESISTSGDSGPYLLYMVARISSMLEKAGAYTYNGVPEEVTTEEKLVILKLAEFPEATQKAVDERDPSHIAKYMYGLAQQFNTFYVACPVLDAPEDVSAFRLQLVEHIRDVMKKGLHILGIKTVSKM